MSGEAARRVGSREKRAPLTFLWSGFHWQGLLFFHRCFSFFPAADLLLPHLEEQDLFLFLVQLCQQIRIYVHLRQDLFQHLCGAGVLHLGQKFLRTASRAASPGLARGGTHRPSRTLVGLGRRQFSKLPLGSHTRLPVQNATHEPAKSNSQDATVSKGAKARTGLGVSLAETQIRFYFRQALLRALCNLYPVISKDTLTKKKNHTKQNKP